jgi:phage-related protein
MSDFNYQPLNGAQIEHEPRVLEAPFGDGYSQRTGDGINTDLPEWNVSFTGTTAYIETIDALLRGYAGVTSFTWAPYGFSEIRVVCRRWSRGLLFRGVGSISAVFAQVPA